MRKDVIKKVTILYTLLIVIISLIPIHQIPFPETSLFQWDKFFHTLVYLVMSMMWITNGFLNTKKLKWSYLFNVFFLGLLIEFFQYILPIGRYFEIADIIANGLGILLGFSMSYYYLLKNKHL